MKMYTYLMINLLRKYLEAIFKFKKNISDLNNNATFYLRKDISKGRHLQCIQGLHLKMTNALFFKCFR